MAEKVEPKDCMFQLAFANGDVVEDTGLITRTEADSLWHKYLDKVIQSWDLCPQMGIWIDCDTTTDYHTVIKEIDYNDCVLKNGHIYKLTLIA